MVQHSGTVFWQYTSIVLLGFPHSHRGYGVAKLAKMVPAAGLLSICSGGLLGAWVMQVITQIYSCSISGPPSLSGREEEADSYLLPQPTGVQRHASQMRQLFSWKFIAAVTTVATAVPFAAGRHLAAVEASFRHQADWDQSGTRLREGKHVSIEHQNIKFAYVGFRRNCHPNTSLAR